MQPTAQVFRLASQRLALECRRQALLFLALYDLASVRRFSTMYSILGALRGQVRV